MCDTGYPRNHSKSVVTVGPRATLPSIYVENELSGNSGSTNLRFRNRISGEESNIHKKSIDSSFDRSLGSSLRSTPSYGTPGTTSSRYTLCAFVCTSSYFCDASERTKFQEKCADLDWGGSISAILQVLMSCFSCH